MAKCRVCGKPNAIFNKYLNMYMCKTDYTKCPGVKKFNTHFTSCPLCRERADKSHIHLKYQPRAYKCFGLTAIHRKMQGKNVDLEALKYKIQLGLEKCAVCGRVAKYHTSGIPCCTSNKRKCPGYHDYLSSIVKQRYRDNPELRVKMSEIMLEAQNREDVAEKKREAMLILHNEDCESCKEFRKKFKEGHKKRRTEKYEQNLKYTLNYRGKHGCS